MKSNEFKLGHKTLAELRNNELCLGLLIDGPRQGILLRTLNTAASMLKQAHSSELVFDAMSTMSNKARQERG